MTRKEFLEQVSGGAGALLMLGCLGGCHKTSTSPSSSAQGPSNVNFTIDVSTGPLVNNGGYTYNGGVIVARTNSGSFIAVASACTHAGGTVQYSSSANNFLCPNHGAQFDTSGNVVSGPAPAALKKYTTTLNGHILTVTG